MTMFATKPASLRQFENENFLNLESFRKNGTGVKTPLWFVEKDGVLYARTGVDTWKVKRIRRNSKVRIVPSDARGNPKGNWIDATAEVTPAEEMPWVNEMSKAKYGVFKRLMDLRSRFAGLEFVVLSIYPD